MVERLSAKKTRISEITSGKFTAGSKEDMRPSYVITRLGDKLSRVSLIAAVVEKFISDDEAYASITIDDGSGMIRAKLFKDVDMIKKVEAGDMVLAIGKIKEYQGEIYVNLEIARKLEPNYEIKQKLEVLKNLMAQMAVAKKLKGLADSMSEEELKIYAQTHGLDEESVSVILESGQLDVDYKPKILQIIESLDEGEGVEAKKLFEALNLPENIIENTLDELLSQGYIYEPKAAVFKKI